jgi:drug/metabolite transporter (DMT)-like permease
MDFIYPLFAVVGEAVATTADKFNYQKNKILPNQLLFLLFSTMTAGLLILAPFINRPLLTLSLGGLALLLFMIIISFGQNFFDYVGLHTKNLSLREPINNFESILASFLAYLFFPSERHVKYIIAILISTVILYASNSNKKLKLKFDKGTIYLCLGVVCSAILACVYKLGLESFSPFYLLLFRVAGVLVLIALFFRPHLRSLRSSQVVVGVGSGLIYIASNLSRLYSIKYLGLNFTIMVLMLGPAIIYMGSSFVLKEKVLPRQVFASAALLLVVMWAIYL